MSINKNQVKGQVKAAAGKIIGDRTLEAKGKMQRTLGDAQSALGDMTQKVKNAVKRG